MKIQTLSVVVPSGCPNKCRFCVSRLHDDSLYTNQIEKNRRFKHLYRSDYLARLAFARDNGCNTIILTGTGEPLMNMDFMDSLATWNRELEHPFRWIELQTSGVSLDEEKLRWLRNEIRVSTISLSLSSIWSSRENAEYNGTPEKYVVQIESLCQKISDLDFNLRLSLNMTDFYNNSSPEEIFNRAKVLGAHQLTFRVLYKSEGNNTPEAALINKWIDEHRCADSVVQNVKDYVQKQGRKLEVLPFGAVRYSLQNISTVVDEDCMTETAKDVVKYLVLRPDCRLYTKWDDPGSLLF
ncbi:MAG: radical SAM protein [Spirochaetales bacterium]|nr:radical SAM protein [Spirochaetales bacterium]